MKLYTEEQMDKAMDFARGHHKMTDTEFIDSLTPIELPSDMLCVNCDESKPTHNICMDCIIKVGKQNIELPSDEEIKEAALKQFPYPIDIKDKNDEIIKTRGEKPFNHAKIEKYRTAFTIGAKYVYSKIQGDKT